MFDGAGFIPKELGDAEFPVASLVWVQDGSVLSPRIVKGSTGAGAAAGTGVVATEGVNGAGQHRTRLTLTGAVITVTDSGGAAGAQGGLKVYDAPEGAIRATAIANLAITGGAGLTATSAVVMAMGSAAPGAGDAALTSTEANLIPSTACTLASSAGTFKGQSTSELLFDGTTSPLDVYLNMAAPDAGATATTTLTVTGTIDIFWTKQGDY